MPHTAEKELAAKDLIERLRRLERAARPLDPGAGRRKQLRDAVVASSERYLRKIRTLKGYVETDDKGIGLLQSPISEDGTSIEAASPKMARAFALSPSKMESNASGKSR